MDIDKYKNLALSNLATIRLPYDSEEIITKTGDEQVQYGGITSQINV